MGFGLVLLVIGLLIWPLLAIAIPITTIGAAMTYFTTKLAKVYYYTCKNCGVRFDKQNEKYANAV